MKYIGIERFDIGCIRSYDGEAVVGYAEEKLVIECSIDQA